MFSRGTEVEHWLTNGLIRSGKKRSLFPISRKKICNRVSNEQIFLGCALLHKNVKNLCTKLSTHFFKRSLLMFTLTNSN